MKAPWILNVSSAWEVDEKVAAEIKAALETGVLKNHRNDTFTCLPRNTARMTHAYKKAQETCQQKKALNVVDKELVSLKDSQKENATRIKELKATKSNIAGKGKSSNAESSSSGKAAVIEVSKRKRVKVASRLATVRAGIFLHSVHIHFLLNILFSPCQQVLTTSMLRLCYPSLSNLKRQTHSSICQWIQLVLTPWKLRLAMILLNLATWGVSFPHFRDSLSNNTNLGLSSSNIRAWTRSKLWPIVVEPCWTILSFPNRT